MLHIKASRYPNQQPIHCSPPLRASSLTFLKGEHHRVFCLLCIYIPGIPPRTTCLLFIGQPLDAPGDRRVYTHAGRKQCTWCSLLPAPDRACSTQYSSQSPTYVRYPRRNREAITPHQTRYQVYTMYPCCRESRTLLVRFEDGRCVYCT